MASVSQEGAEVTTVTRGGSIPLGDLVVEVLHPGPLSGDSNEDSMVLLVSCGVVDALLTGDAEIPSEESMLAAGVVREVEVLKVGHHGSRTATSQGFLDLASPEVGVISAGEENQYGHPHSEVVERLQAAGVEILATDTTEADNTLVMETDCQRYGFSRTRLIGG